MEDLEREEIEEQETVAFIGREAELKELLALVEENTLVHIHGLQGVGKTQLAEKLTHQWVELGDQRMAVLLPLASNPSAENILNLISDGLPDDLHSIFGNLAFEGKRDLIKDFLKEHETLIIIDDLRNSRLSPKNGEFTTLTESAQQALKDLFIMFQEIEQKILLTTNEEMGWTEVPFTSYKLGGLNDLDGVALTLHLMMEKEETITLPPETVQAFSQAAKGHPAIIKLMTPIFVKESDKTIQALQELEPKEFSHLWLESALELGLELADHNFKTFLPVLSLFEGVAWTPFVEEICKSSACKEFQLNEGQNWSSFMAEAEQLGLASHLVMQEFYSIPQWVRTYLKKEYLQRKGNFEEGYKAVAELIDEYANDINDELDQSPDVEDMLSLISVAKINEETLLASIYRALMLNQWEHIPEAADLLSRIYRVESREAEWVGLLESMYALIGERRDQSDKSFEFWVFCIGNLSDLYVDAERFGDAQKNYEHMLEVVQSRKGDYDPWIADIYQHLGLMDEEQKAWDSAQNWYDKALRLKRSLKDYHGAASLLFQIGLLAEKQSNWKRAEYWYLKAVTVFQEVGDHVGLANVYHHMGLTSVGRKNLSGAENWFGKSLALEEEFENPFGAASNTYQLARLALERKNLDKAKTLLDKAIEMWDAFDVELAEDVLETKAELEKSLG